MIRKSLLALAAIAALGVVVAPAADAIAKPMQGPKGFSNGKGPGPTQHPKGPQKWAGPKGGKPGKHYHGHGHHHGYGLARFGISLIANQMQGPDCYRIITRSGRIKTVCTY